MSFIDETVVSCTEHHVMNKYGAGGLAPRVVWSQHEMDVSVRFLFRLYSRIMSPWHPFDRWLSGSHNRSDTWAKRKPPY